jgi:hypothetical protein
MIIDTIPIVFNAGAYGTYLEWCLTTLTTDIDITPPFTATGSSHRFNGRHLLNMEGWHNYIDDNAPSIFVRLHPKTKKEDSLTNNLKIILSTVEKMIYLYPDRSSVLLNVNNTFNKISTEWWPAPGSLVQKKQDYNILADKIYQNWPVSRSVPFDNIPCWIKREFLSLYLMPAWYDQVEWFFLDRWQHPNCLVVFIKDLLYNFKYTMQHLQKSLNLDFKKDIDLLVPYHLEMLKKQIHYEQDSLCNQIVNSTIQCVDFDWVDRYLSLPSEGWVQWQLRNLGFELQCHDLDIFPTNSKNLKELLYKI